MTHQDREREEREMKARLEKLSGELGANRKHATDERAREETAMASGQETGKAFSLAFRMISELIGGILVGVGIGWGLDKLLTTSPIFIIIFSLLGTAAGFWNVIRAASSTSQAGKDGTSG